MIPIPLAFIGGSELSAVGNTHRIASEMDNRFELVAGCFSRDPSINQSTASNWGIESHRTYASWKELLDQEDSQTTVIALLTPTPHHAEVLDAAMSRKFRVICEKSLTSTMAEVELLAQRIQEDQSNLYAVYNYTGYPMIRELRGLVLSGFFGTVLHCEVEMPQEGFLRRNQDGTAIQPQDWRRRDDSIPTVSLDLGIHVVNLFRFVTGETIRRIIGVYQSRGNVPGVVDRISALADCTNEVKADFKFGKTSLGKSNGLSISIFGSHGSGTWVQTNPEYLILSDCFGDTRQVHRGSSSCVIAQQSRYNRFKAGHPSGFLEAFSNHYFDIADSLMGSINEPEYVFSVEDALIDMSVLNALSRSVERDAWIEI